MGADLLLRRWLSRLWICVLLCALLPLTAPAAPATPASDDTDVLIVYVRDGCPHCAAAKEYLPQFAAERPWLRIDYRAVDQSERARDELMRIARDTNNWPPGVPTFVFNGRVLAGFGEPETSGPQLAALVEQRQQVTDRIEGGWLGTLSVDRLGLPLFTLAIGLLDGFNPCAMWVLLFLLSMLVHLRDRRRMALIAGTFVLVSGAIYFAFMAAWLNIFLAVGLSNALRIGLALVALVIAAVNIRDAVRSDQGFSLSIPDAVKPGLYARMRSTLRADSLLLSLAGVASLAVVVNIVELLCTAGLPAMYTAILTQQGLSPAAHYAYLALYILGYITDDALMVGTAVFALSSRKLTETAGRRLKLLSGLVMLALGAIMLWRPEWLI
jgi:glutaredoxin